MSVLGRRSTIDGIMYFIVQALVFLNRGLVKQAARPGEFFFSSSHLVKRTDLLREHLSADEMSPSVSPAGVREG